MLEQLAVFASRLYAKRGGFATFMSHPRSPVNASLDDLYELDLGDEERFRWQRTEGRYGLLTMPAFLAAKATPSHTSIVRRGLFVSEHLLCRAVSPPPAGVDTTIPPPAPGETTRQRYERHATDPACASCHRRMDPLGLALEHYDKAGRYRRDEGGAPIDASGRLALDGRVHAFSGVAQLSSILASSAGARASTVARFRRRQPRGGCGRGPPERPHAGRRALPAVPLPRRGSARCRGLLRR